MITISERGEHLDEISCDTDQRLFFEHLGID